MCLTQIGAQARESAFKVGAPLLLTPFRQLQASFIFHFDSKSNPSYDPSIIRPSSQIYGLFEW